MTPTLRRFILWLIPVVLLSFFIVPHSFLPAPASPAGTALAAGGKQAAPSLAHVSLAFEPNRGQAPASVRYLAHGPGYTLYLTASGVYLSLSKETGMPQPQRAFNPFAKTVLPASPARTKTAVLGLLPERTASHVTMTATDKLPGIVNYFIGNKPSQWHTGIPTYGRVTYHNVYPRIDLVFYGSGSRPEYDWVVRPGGNPAMIRLHVTGAQRLALGRHGQLLMTTTLGESAQAPPHIWQRRELAVRGGFVLRGQDVVGVRVGHYDRSRPLVIDPALVLDYSTYLGGTQCFTGTFTCGDQVDALAVDASGNAYVAGTTGSIDFPTCGSFPKCAAPGTAIQPSLPSAGSGASAFVSKLNASGTELLYSTYLGGRYDYNAQIRRDEAFGIAVDGAGEAFVTGETASTSFPVCGSFPKCSSPGTAIQSSLSGQQDAFVSKLSSNGSQLLYSTYLGGSETHYPVFGRASTEGSAIAVTSAGDATVVGTTDALDFPVCGPFAKCAFHGRAVEGYFSGGDDAFITELNPSGTALLNSSYLGGTGDDLAKAVAVDAVGNVYVAGETWASNFPVCGSFPKCASPGTAIQPTHGPQPEPYPAAYDGSDAFLAKLNPSETELLYSTYLGGSAHDEADAVAADSAGNAYVTGDTWSTDFPVCGTLAKCASPGTALRSSPGGYIDAFVSKVNPSGTQLQYSTYLGGIWADWGSGIAADNSGDAYVVGSTQSPDFPVCGSYPACTVMGTAIRAIHNGNYDGFVTKLNQDGQTLAYSTFLGGSYGAHPYAVSLNESGSVYVAGEALSSDFPVCGTNPRCVSPGTALQPLARGGFITKIQYNPDTTPPVIAPTVTGTQGAHGWYTSAVQVSWSVSDSDSPIFSTSGCSPTSIAADTAGTNLTCAATSAGGTDSQSVTIKRDATIPSIAVTGTSAGPPRSATLTVQDVTSGLASITIPQSSNCTITGTTGFTPGTTAPVQVTAARQDNATTCSLAVQATDEAGNVSTLDPAILLTAVGPQSPATDRLSNVAGTDNQVTVVNGQPGLQTVMVVVNGHLFPFLHLQAGETRVVDVSSAMHPGETNSVLVLGVGAPAAGAAILLGPPSASGAGG